MSTGVGQADRSVLAIGNPAAAGGRAWEGWRRWVAGLSAGHGRLEARTTQRPGQALEWAHDAASRYDVVVAGGGDGTVNEVASGLLLEGEPKAALGVLPLGTGNDFAAQVGVGSLKQAAAALAAGSTRWVDTIEVRAREAGRDLRRHALVFAAVGFGAEVLRRTAPWIKRVFGPRLCYSVGFFRALRHFAAPGMSIRAGDHRYQGPVFHVCAGNAEWAGGGVMRLSPGAALDDQKMEVCLIEALRRLEILRCFPMLLRGTHPRHPKVRYFSAPSVEVDSEPPAALQLDGDVIGHTPATFTLRPRSLRVVAPTANPAL